MKRELLLKLLNTWVVTATDYVGTKKTRVGLRIHCDVSLPCGSQEAMLRPRLKHAPLQCRLLNVNFLTTQSICGRGRDRIGLRDLRYKDLCLSEESGHLRLSY